MDSPTAEQLLHPKEFFNLAGISRAHGYRLIDRKDIAIVRAGRSVRIPLSAYREWVRRHTIPAQSAAMEMEAA